MKYLDSDNERRREIAKKYDEALSQVPGIVIPGVRSNSKHVYHLYVVMVEKNKRDFLIDQARLKGIVLGIHYPVPVHMQPAYINRLVIASQMSKTVNISKCVVSLPMYPELKINQIEKVCKFIKESV